MMKQVETSKNNMNIAQSSFKVLFHYKMDRNNSSKLAESKIKDITNSINIQFSRQCPNSQSLLHRLTDDLIARYSSKQQPHPQFFKQDTTLAINQFTLFSDQYLQVMRKFDFLSTPANIFGNLTSSALRLCDFMGKKLHQYMKISEPVPITQDIQILCSSCGKLRQNQKIRALKDALHLDFFDKNMAKIKREVTTRTGQKYDVQQLLQQQLQNLDMLNQQQIRKRLTNLQQDHDKRKQQMLICIEELKRANERVAGYSRVLDKDKKGKDNMSDNKFNIKQYVFQLGRHFCHNLSNIDNKIKLLRHNISPMIDMDSQTQNQMIQRGEHQMLIQQLQQELNTTSQGLKQHKLLLTIEQRKNKQVVQNNSILDQRLKELQKKVQEEQVGNTLEKSHMQGTIVFCQNKIKSLQTIIKKIKSNVNIKSFTDEELSFCSIVKTNTTGVQCQQQTSRQQQKQNENKKKGVRMIRTRQDLKTTMTIHPRFLRQISNISNLSNISNPQEPQQSQTQELSPSFQEIINQLFNMHKSRHEIIHAVVNQSFIPSNSCLKPPISRQSIEESEQFLKPKISMQQFLADQTGNSHKKSLKPGKLGTYKKRLQKLGTLRNRKSVLGFQRENDNGNSNKKVSVDRDSYNNHISAETSMQKMVGSKNKLKTLYQLKNEQKKSGNTGQNYHGYGQYAIKGKDYHGLYKQNKKLKRHFSQQNSFQECQQQRYSLQKQLNQKKILSQINQLINIRHSEGDNNNNTRMMMKNNDRYSTHQKGQFMGSKVTLNLQEISYCTYFYSLMANLRIKNVHFYRDVKKHVCKLSGEFKDQEQGVKEALKHLLVLHRKCKKSGTVCCHLENLLEIVKNM